MMGEELSEREQAVLGWLTHGLSNKEIGLALSISPRTVQKHLQRIYQQLGVQTRAEAIVRIHRRARNSGI
ncbi:MAG: helix-turn-helix transcriptional regulator [Nitrospira sp.]|nr:helix-turn-helix transcriptional regulator [Nitrospira sp.]MBH0183624.1 helix-turn-helix transcriptional regulator [Nitrospira sp.]MBH0186492.1 helix-turn-helix transcriptional regulator [Nitrospira sp.]